MSTLFLECGTTLRSPFNTGIQRVVRNIINAKPSIEGLKEVDACYLVEYLNGEFFTISEISIAHAISDDILVSGLRKFIKSLKQTLPSSLYQFLRNRTHGLYVHLVNTVNHRKLLKEQKIKSSRKNILEINVPPDETKLLLLLDSTWDQGMWTPIVNFRKSGGNVCAVLYDLIPFLHPETVETATREIHIKWWFNAPKYLDSILCISKSVRDEFYNWQTKNITRPLPLNAIDYFYLGAEIGKTDPVVKVISDPTPFFLMVGSIEPRKNHALVLDAFDAIWDKGCEASLVMCANNSWHSDELISRIKNHKNFNKHLFLVEKSSDRDLVYLNKACCAVIMASFAEGFGLPIVEAIQLGAKVICNDIPVFREIGGNDVTYFKYNDTASLSEILRMHVGNHAPSRPLKKSEQHWITWEQSAQILIEKALQLSSAKIKN